LFWFSRLHMSIPLSLLSQKTTSFSVIVIKVMFSLSIMYWGSSKWLCLHKKLSTVVACPGQTCDRERRRAPAPTADSFAAVELREVCELCRWVASRGVELRWTPASAVCTEWSSQDVEPKANCPRDALFFDDCNKHLSRFNYTSIKYKKNSHWRDKNGSVSRVQQK